MNCVCVMFVLHVNACTRLSVRSPSIKLCPSESTCIFLCKCSAQFRQRGYARGGCDCCTNSRQGTLRHVRRACHVCKLTPLILRINPHSRAVCTLTWASMAKCWHSIWLALDCARARAISYFSKMTIWKVKAHSVFFSISLFCSSIG